MSMPEFERLLAALIPGRGRTALTLTEPPQDEATLMRLFDKALVAGNGRASPLSAIQAPMSLYPNLGDMFWHVPVEDTGADGVVRLIFDTPEQRVA